MKKTSLREDFVFLLFVAAIIRGNHTNCSQFANASRLNWLFSKLGGEGAGMMDVLYCILNDSPEGKTQAFSWESLANQLKSEKNQGIFSTTERSEVVLFLE